MPVQEYLALENECCLLGLKRGQMRHDHIPTPLRPDTEVTMRQPVPEVGNGAPGNLGMSLLVIIGEVRNGIGEAFEADALRRTSKPSAGQPKSSRVGSTPTHSCLSWPAPMRQPQRPDRKPVGSLRLMTRLPRRDDEPKVAQDAVAGRATQWWRVAEGLPGRARRRCCSGASPHNATLLWHASGVIAGIMDDRR